MVRRSKKNRKGGDKIDDIQSQLDDIQSQLNGMKSSSSSSMSEDSMSESMPESMSESTFNLHTNTQQIIPEYDGTTFIIHGINESDNEANAKANANIITITIEDEEINTEINTEIEPKVYSGSYINTSGRFIKINGSLFVLIQRCIKMLDAMQMAYTISSRCPYKLLVKILNSSGDSEFYIKIWKRDLTTLNEYLVEIMNTDGDMLCVDKAFGLLIQYLLNQFNKKED